jgi:hypothetical protein
MKQFIIIFLITLGAIHLSAQKKYVSKNIVIKGRITQTSDYCGGAQPTEEKLAELRSKQPVEGKIIYIRQVNSSKKANPIIKKVMTDARGNFKVVLRSGFTYHFIEEWKHNPLEIPRDTEFVKWDENCFKTRYKTPDYILKVKSKGNSMVSINYHNPCFYRPYCGNYTGPLPP